MKSVIGAIKKHKRFLITAHVNLEGDSLGSQLAMKELLESLGKEAFVLDHDKVPELYHFLPQSKDVLNDLNAKYDFDAAVVLDCPTMKRVGDVAKIIKDGFIINIDHHISNENFGAVNWIDPRASSAGEMVFRLFKESGIAPTKESALAIYIAILTDTGSFNYDNTSRMTHEVAGELLGYGIDPAGVSESVYEKRSIRDIKLLGLVLSTLKVSNDGEVAYMEVTKEALKETGADLSKSEGLVNYARSIDGVKVAILFKEETRKPGSINVSFRAKGDVDVNMIASFFKGGGHKRASGCVISGTLRDVEQKVLAKVAETLENKK